jgi:ATP-dependent exoDNAse (exonuclease V) beta subunit
MDEPKLFREAVDLLLDKVGENPHITHHLVDYVQYSVEEEKRANVVNKLLDLRLLITSEEARDALGSLKSADERVFEDLKKSLYAHVQEYVKELREIGQEAVDFMAKRGIDHQDLLGGSVGLYKYFGQLAEFIDGNKKVTCHKSYHPNTSESLAKKGLSENRKALVESCEGQLRRYFQRAEASLEKYPNYQLAKELLKQMDFLAVIKDLSSARDELIAEQNILPISAFNRIISESLRNEPVAFIYEKFGNRYHHVLIDEFQDTSEMQWKNLLPFIVNSLSFGNLNMVVGDAKQSIYRWRGGKAEQLIRLPELDPDDHSISQDARATIAQNGLIRALDTNYRSLRNIVEFNNSFVEAMTPLWTAENSLFRQEYTGTSATQHYPDGKKGGYVEIRHFNEEIQKEATIRQTMAFIEEALNDGYEYGDIAILIRKRTKEAVALIELLHDSGIPVSTADSFGLDQDEMVVMLAELIRLSAEPDSETAKVKIMRALCHLHDIPYAPHAYWSIQDKKGKVLLDDFLAAHFPDYKREHRDSGSALKIAEWAMAKLIPADLRQSTFLNSFLNHLITEGGRSESPGAFIERWDAMKDKPDATHTSEGNKIRLMTIHKAKGLQFPVVIAFDLNWKRDNHKTIKWVSSKIELPFSHIPLKHVSRMEELGYGEELVDYKREVDFDNLNLIYVAITRPSERLYASVSTGRSNGTGKPVGEVLTKLSEKWEKEAPFPFHHTTISEGDEDGTCEVYQVGLKEPPGPKQKAKAEKGLFKALPPAFMPVEERFTI